MAAKEGERISEPNDVDVLCGRGGISNHHPGNEWYRRLIRSNRPLYRACPKHTKLLVSKAIVQAVEQQGGRFLDRNRKENYWYQVTYKRAVDKTSQGLREKDRNNEDDEDDEDEEEAQEVPDSFSGRSKVGPNLSDLAAVAIGHANKSKEAEKFAPGDSRKRASKGPEEAAAKRMRVMPSKGDLLDDDDDPTPPRAVGTLLSGGLQPGQTELLLADDDPLPPNLEPRQSSMFRLLRGTPLFSSTSTFGNGTPGAAPGQARGYPTKLNNLPKDNRANLPPGMFSYASGLFGSTPAAPPAPQYQPPPVPQQYVPPFQQQPPPQPGGAPPPLTRLTSQVSDWLTSFWPLPSRHDTMVAAPANAPRFASARPEPKLPPAIQQRLKIPASMDREVDTARQSARTNVAVADPYRPTKRKSQPSVPPLPYSAAPGPWAAPDHENGAPLPPTELEQSVSTTLLKLAASPSVLLQNLTSFFDRNETQALGALAQVGAAQASFGPDGAVRRTSQSRQSLLDDYDETPQEAALRGAR